MDTKVDQNIQKTETSSSKGIKYKGTQCVLENVSTIFFSLPYATKSPALLGRGHSNVSLPQ